MENVTARIVFLYLAATTVVNDDIVARERRRPPQQLDILGRPPIRLVDQIGQAALQPKRLGLALPPPV
jgi:hypothetical protein